MKCSNDDFSECTYRSKEVGSLYVHVPNKHSSIRAPLGKEEKETKVETHTEREKEREREEEREREGWRETESERERERQR